MTKTKEVGGEILIPVLNDKPFAETLNITSGFRFSDQDVTGTEHQWKVGVEWRPVQSLFFRGSAQRSIRAPNIGELFTSDTGGEAQVGIPPAGGDPCDFRSQARMGPQGEQIVNCV